MGMEDADGAAEKSGGTVCTAGVLVAMDVGAGGKKAGEAWRGVANGPLAHAATTASVSASRQMRFMASSQHIPNDWIVRRTEAEMR